MPTEKKDTETVAQDDVASAHVVMTPETAPDEVTDETAPATGVRARRAFTMKNLLPGQDWIMREIVAKGKGARATIGRIYGHVTSFADKVNDIQGIPTPSIALNGIFEAQSDVTGELSQAVTVFLPMAYAEQVKAAFLSDTSLKSVIIDIDVGIEATGKSIPYEWIVSSHTDNIATNALASLRNSRKRVADPALTAPAEQAKLAAPA